MEFCGGKMKKNVTRLATVISAVVATIAISASAAMAATTWSKAASFGKAIATMTPSGDLKLRVEAQDLLGDSNAVTAEVDIVSGDQTTHWRVVNSFGYGSSQTLEKRFDGGNVGFSGHVKIRICKWRQNGIPGGLSWGCTAWASRSYSL
ncbi:hypothetical protein JIG36_21295 [Actinoplanes sp. LDG1-06]|uniref:Uncharacterized protein n=1 Tax=Paractinoplanes ovalisporus TaxID=2810368 RepID=A0ABS2AFP3_9ACTN|nr:hypothetical protein [Actinoplanes ovalisporus]MBM2618096.1 hypothetical protein [Actinoplanes ovalisporus]